MKTERYILFAACFAPVLLTACATDPARDTPAASPVAPAAQNVSGPAAVFDGNAALSGYVAYALSHNSGLLAAKKRWTAAREKAIQAGAWPDPRIKFARENGADFTSDTYGVYQALPFFGKSTLAADIETASAEAEWHRFEAQRLKLARDVKVAYGEYYYLGRRTRITEEMVQLLKTAENSIKTRYATGAEPHAALLQARIEIAKIENELENFRQMRRPLFMKLKALLNFTDPASLPWPDNVTNSPVEMPATELLPAIRTRNPELKAMDAMIKAGNTGVSLAKTAWIPDLEVGYEKMNETMDKVSSGVARESDTFMVSFTIPLWVTKNNAAVRESNDRKEGATADREQKERDLEVELAAALANRRDAGLRVELFRDSLIPKAGQIAEVARKEFETGTKTLAELVAAQRVLLEFSLALERAQTDYMESSAEIEMLLGGNLPVKQENK